MKNSTRRTSLGSELIEGLSELADVLERGQRLDKRFTVRKIKLNRATLQPGKYSPTSIRKTRQQLGVSQAIFAQLIGVSIKLIQAWEQGTRIPESLARHVLDDINHQPGKWLLRLHRAASPARRSA